MNERRKKRTEEKLHFLLSFFSPPNAHKFGSIDNLVFKLFFVYYEMHVLERDIIQSDRPKSVKNSHSMCAAILRFV